MTVAASHALFRPRLIARAVVVAVVVGVAACGSGDGSAGGSSAGVPPLGVDWGGTRGYGAVEPEEIFNGGDPTGLVEDIDWESWGGEQAVGHGFGYYSPPRTGASGARREPVTVIAFDPGECDGEFAYLDVRWFFVEAGEEIDLDGDPWYDICDQASESS